MKGCQTPSNGGIEDRDPKPDPKPRKPDPEPDPKPKKGGKGTLVAIAIGGSCAFSVDGAPKGTKSSLRLKVPTGPHTVSCAPAGKATRTQRGAIGSHSTTETFRTHALPRALR